MLILPGDPEFNLALFTLPFDWREVADRIGQQCSFVVCADSGLLRPVTNEELTDYLYGGEYDERLIDLDDDSQ